MADSIDTRELERRSQDRLKVLNPTSSEQRVIWDGFVHRVPTQGEAVFPRYIAEKYLKEMTDKILLERQDDAVRGENEKRRDSGKEPMEKFGEQHTFEDKYRFAQGVSNPEARKQVMKSLYGGVVEEYGLDLRPETRVERDNRPLDAQLLEEIQAEVDGLSPLEQLPARDDLSDKNVPQLQKVAREKGIEYQKTDTKEALIAKLEQ